MANICICKPNRRNKKCPAHMGFTHPNPKRRKGRIKRVIFCMTDEGRKRMVAELLDEKRSIRKEYAEMKPWNTVSSRKRQVALIKRADQVDEILKELLPSFKDLLASLPDDDT